jgi:hypothetical protein
LTPFVEEHEDLSVLAAQGVYRGADFGSKLNRVISRSAIGSLVQIVHQFG